MKKDNSSPTSPIGKLLLTLTEPSLHITDILRRRQSRLLSSFLLIIIPLGSTIATVQLLTVPGFLPTFLTVTAAIAVMSIAYVLTRTRYYLMAAILTVITSSIASYASLLNKTPDESSFGYLLIGVLLSSIMLNPWFTLGIAALNLIGLLFLPSLQPIWTFQVLSGKIGYHIIIPVLIFITMRYRDLVEADRQKELRESELKFRSIFDHSVDAIGVSKTGVHVMVNPAYLRIFGYESADQLVGKSILDLIAPSHRPQILNYVRQRAAGEEIPSKYETRGLRRDGTEFDMEVHVSTYELGGELYTVPILRDITERKKGEEQIRYQVNLLKYVSDSIIATDLNFKITSWNQAAETLYGWSASEVVGRLVSEILQTAYPPESAEEVLRQFNEQGFWKGEVVQKRKDGTPMDIMGSISWVLDENGQRMGVVAVNRDITERRRMEEALRESESRFRALFEESPIPIWEEDFSLVKQRIDVLRAQGVTDFEEYFSTRPDEVVACAALVRVLDVNKAALEMYHAEKKEDLLNSLRNVPVTSEALAGLREELIGIANGGTVHYREDTDKTLTGEPIQVSLSWRVAPGHEYNLSKVIVSIIDITKRKQAEEKLQTAEAELRRIMQSVSDYLWSADMDERGQISYRYYSPVVEKITGHAPEFFMENPERWLSTLHPDDRPQVFKAFGRLVGHTSTREEEEYRIVCADGQVRWVRDSVIAIPLPNGHYQISGVVSDITERKEAEEALRLSEETAKAFQEKLWLLHEVNLELSGIGSLDELYRSTVEMGLKKLEFERFGLFLIEENGKYLTGTFGTDEKGMLRDERHVKEPINETQNRFVLDWMRNRTRSTHMKDVVLQGAGQALDRNGSNVLAIVWDGAEAIGMLATDNYLTQRPLPSFMEDLLSIYGNIIGHQIGRIRKNQALRNSEEQYRITTELMSDYIFKLDIDPNGSVTMGYLSENYQAITGHTLDQVRSTESWSSIIHPEDLGMLMNLLRSIIATRQSGELECRSYGKDGKQRWVHVVARPMTDHESGAVTKIVGSVKDITERKRAEEALRTSEAQLSTALRMANAGHWEYDVPSDTFTFNDNFYRIFRTTAEEVGSYKMSSAEYARRFCYPDDIWLVEKEVQAAIETTDPNFNRQLEHRILYKDGEIGYTAVRFFIIKDSQGRTMKTYGVNQDITEHKQAEREREKLISELEAKNIELERFAYTVSHDLKSPLVTINGFLGFLEHDAASGNLERHKQDSQRIREAVNKMHHLLSDLLELSRIGRMMNAPENVPFATIVQDALEIVHGQPEERKITVHVQPNLPLIQGDRQRLTEVLQNLLDNAVKYMGDQAEPHIEIGQRGEENGKPIFFVKDNGIGISPEYHERIFGLFNKLDARSEGTGIGLALVKRIIGFHNSRLWIESELGKGSTFYFTLPRG